MAKRYVALLRGINVGGKNLIKMPVLEACFQAQGHTDVSTYIQSGNVLFAARKGTSRSLESSLETALEGELGTPLTVVVRSLTELRTTVERAPAGFGSQPDRYRYDVIFLKDPLTAAKLRAALPSLKEGVDEVSNGPGALYWSRLTAKASSSRLSKIASLPEYKSTTIRNWNTTTKLLDLLDRHEVSDTS
jgi:uncharacterized protein (DUF1697 family)